jgi:peptidyl-prolyl cis-trans isomerase C
MLWFFLMACLAAAGGAPSAGAEEDPVVARMGDNVIRQSELKHYIDEVRRRDKDALATIQARQAYLDQIIGQKLLAEEARRIGLDRIPEVKMRIDNAVDIILAQQYYQQMRDGITPAPEALKAYYDENPDQFRQPEEVHVKHIIVADREAAENAMAELDKGRPFETVARQVNMDGSKQRGGDIGWYPRGRLVPAFETAAFALQKGEVSDIVPTRFGFHIIKLEDRREAGVKPFEAVEDDVRQRVIQALMDQQHDAIVTRLRSEHRVEIFREAIP